MAVSEEGSSARVVRNTLVNGLGSVAGVLIYLALTPFLIDEFGLTAYGVFALALTLSFLGGYASLVDLGVEGAVARYVAEARSDGDAERVNRVVSTGLAFFCGLSIVLTPVLVVLSIGLIDVFDVPDDLRTDAIWCFALVAGQVIFELPARIAYAALEGSQRFTTYQLIELVRAFAQASVFAAAIVFDWSIAALGAALPFGSLIVLVVGWWLAKRTIPELRVSPRLVSRDVFRTLMSFGGSLFIIRLTGTVYRQMDKAIIGIALGARYVTTYEIANRIHSGAAMVQSIAASALLPAAAYSRERLDIIRDMYVRGTTYTVAAALPVTVAAFIFAEPLIRTWVGEDLLDATVPTQLFLVYLAFVVVHIVGATMAVALGHTRVMTTVAVGNLAVNLGLSVALVGPLGIEGVVLGTVIAQTLAWVWLLRFFLHTFQVDLGEWAMRIVVPNLPGLALQAASAVPLLALADGAGNLVEVGFVLLVSVALSLAGFLLLGLAREQRAVLFGTLRAAVGLRARA
jgi:O-antigen/teichoic acid export membrane protein